MKKEVQQFQTFCDHFDVIQSESKKKNDHR